MIRRTAGTLLGKSAAAVVKIRGKSSGQAFPGLVVQKLVPGYLGKMLDQLPDGIVIITGTNGKTTTTKMVVAMLRDQGKRVLTNATGSNLTRGIISSVSQQATKTGKIPFDIAIFELDEAYARQFTDTIRPSWVLALNASRDQLDRFGEVDMVAEMISSTMVTATRGMIVNADDKRLSAVAAKDGSELIYFGVAPKLLKFFPRDDEIVSTKKNNGEITSSENALSVELLDFNGSEAVYRIREHKLKVSLRVTGQHNFQNAAGALALVQAVLPAVRPEKWLTSLARVEPAFGRGQTYKLVDGSILQLNLVKNPASFRQGLASYVRANTAVMIAINDAIADSRDMSWLWDIDFSSLDSQKIVFTTGTRAPDMALRLQYDDITVANIEPNIEQALDGFIAETGDKVIFASYTAMLKLHAILEKSVGKDL